MFLNIGYNYMFKDQTQCEHGKLYFGSGDFYIFCSDCGRGWVHYDPSKGDNTPSYDNSTLDFGNEYRVKFPDNLTFVELKAKEKGLDCDDRDSDQKI